MSRRGRKRNATRQRHDCGKIVQPRPAQLEREVLSAGLEARVRIYGLRRHEASRQEASHAIGRACLKGEISPAQMEAGLEYERIQHAYRSAIGAKNVYSGGDFDRRDGFDGSDGDDPAYVEWCATARSRMADSRRALLDANPLAQLAVDGWVGEQKELWGLLGELRLGLNALVRLYGFKDRIAGTGRRVERRSRVSPLSESAGGDNAQG